MKRTRIALFSILIIVSLLLVTYYIVSLMLTARQSEVSEDMEYVATPTVETFSNDAESDNTSSDAADSVVPEGETDLGFRPEANGFSFENYGNDSVKNLTSVEMQRMFGDVVCAHLSGNNCILTPPAKQWMTEINNYMDGGHCEGMAVLSLLIFMEEIDPNQFGATKIHQLSLVDNEALQRELAYWWTTQATTPADTIRIDESPRAVVDALIETYTSYPKSLESWVMGISMADHTAGHAITPYALEDAGGGIYNVLVYDNNWPDMGRVLEVDYDANTWKYQASINPDEPESLYEGSAETRTLELVGISQRLVPQQCPFCADYEQQEQRNTFKLADPSRPFNQIWLNGQADLLITTTDGKRIGFVDGEFINEIPDAHGQNMRFGVDVWDLNNEPVYYIPLGVEFSIEVDASRATEGIFSDVTLIGPGYNMVIADLYLDPGASDVITISPDGSMLSYSTEYNDTPDMIFGIETPAADYEFIVAALDIEAGAEFAVELDIANGLLSINTSNTTEPGTYEIIMYRIDDDGESWFQNDDIRMEPGDTAYLPFEEWEGPGSSIFIDIDYGSDGEIDESIELLDEYRAEE